MSGKCCECGKSIGSWFGLPPATPQELAKLEELGCGVDGELCNLCYHKLLDEVAANPRTRIANITVSTITPYLPNEYNNLGFVSAHVALGTGPLNQLFSGVTDLLGDKSESYNRKMIEAERHCLESIKRSAQQLDADEIIGLHTTYTELTQGHGMLLVCMTGTAIKMKDNHGVND